MTYLIIVALAIACIISYFFVPTGVFAAFILIWLGWSVYALIKLKGSSTETSGESEIFLEMRQNDRGRIFFNYISGFRQQYSRLEERNETLRDFSGDGYEDCAESFRDAVLLNFEKAKNYMKACDYRDQASKKDYQSKIDALYRNNQNILNQQNELIGLLAEADNAAESEHKANMARVEDIMASLREMAGTSTLREEK